MPTYEYACTSCGHRLEAYQSFSDEPLTTCPECGGALRKVFGSVGIVLKGPGFYRTDSRNGSGASRTSKDTGAEKDKEKVAAPSAAGSSTNGSSTGSSDSSSSGSSSSGSSGSGSSSSGSSSGSTGSGSGSSPAKTAAG